MGDCWGAMTKANVLRKKSRPAEAQDKASVIMCWRSAVLQGAPGAFGPPPSRSAQPEPHITRYHSPAVAHRAPAASALHLAHTSPAWSGEARRGSDQGALPWCGGRSVHALGSCASFATSP